MVSGVGFDGGGVSGAVEREPEAAALLFGGGITKARAYAAALAREAEPLGLLGPLELARLWSRHVVNSALVGPMLRAGRVLDVGSGAGLPGIPLAIARPDAHLVLIEPMERRAQWLRQTVADLGLENVTVIRARAEEILPEAKEAQVTARAVSALRRLVPLAARLVPGGGQLLLLKGASVDREIAAAQPVFARWGIEDATVRVLGEDFGVEPTRVFCATVLGRRLR